MKQSELRQLIRKLITEDDSTESYLAPSRFTFEPNDKRKDLMIHKLVDEYQEEIFDYLWNYSGYKNSFNEGVLKENDSYQLVLAQSANLEIPEDFEQLETREYKDMLNKLHDSYGEDKYTKEPAHFLSTAIDYILDDPREDDLKTAHEFLHKHKNAAAKELRQTIKEELQNSLNEDVEDVKPSQLYGRTKESHKQLEKELTKLFMPSNIGNLNNIQILDIVKDINRITRKVNNLRKER